LNRQPRLFELPDEPLFEQRRVQGGEATSDVMVSAHVGGNADVFPRVLALHVPKGSKIADITWGQGVFWKKVPAEDYEIVGSDLKSGVDCRKLPYEDESFDCVLFDPPYMEGFFRKSESHLGGSGSHSAFRKAYSNGEATAEGGPKWHAAVVHLYVQGERNQPGFCGRTEFSSLSVKMKSARTANGSPMSK